jgi:hypothetical protein
MYLVELTLDMVRQVLKPGGNYVVKVFQGEGSDQFLKQVRSSFEKVLIRKPDASRRARAKSIWWPRASRVSRPLKNYLRGRYCVENRLEMLIYHS